MDEYLTVHFISALLGTMFTFYFADSFNPSNNPPLPKKKIAYVLHT